MKSGDGGPGSARVARAHAWVAKRVARGARALPVYFRSRTGLLGMGEPGGSGDQLKANLFRQVRVPESFDILRAGAIADAGNRMPEAVSKFSADQARPGTSGQFIYSQLLLPLAHQIG